jgi:hypothetical protein
MESLLTAGLALVVVGFCVYFLFKLEARDNEKLDRLPYKRKQDKGS